uniref:Deoxynucleoside monophosphate kinase n=1 Tax=viral metagenome TaxID=1070528 RepID=A0A6C0DMM6_9ZZZZ
MIVGILGLKGSGKDTIGNYLIDNYNFEKIAYAGALKDAICCVFGWDRNMMEGATDESRKWREEIDEYWGFSPREMMQRIGTDLFRKQIKDDIWIKSLKLKLEKLTTNVVITDCRFNNEIDLIKDKGGIIILVEREPPSWINIIEEYKAKKLTEEEAVTLLQETGIHESEWRCYLYNNIDYYVKNTGSIEELYNKLKMIF